MRKSPALSDGRKSTFGLPITQQDLRVFRYLRPYWRAILFGFACASIAGLLTSAPILILKSFGDALLAGGGDLAKLQSIAWAMFFLTIAAAAAHYGQNFVLRAVGFRIVQTLRSELVQHYQRVSLDRVQTRKAGDLTSRVLADSQMIQVSTQILVDAVNEPFRLLTLLGLAVYMAPKLAAIFGIGLPVMLVLVRRINSAIRRYAKKTQAGMGESAGLLTESLAGAREVRAFGLEDHEVSRFEKEHADALAQALKGARATAAGPSLVMLVGAISSSLVIWVGGSMVVNGTLTLPSLLAFLAAIGVCYEPIRRMTRTLSQVAHLSGAANRIFEILDEPTSVPDTGTKIAPADLDVIAFDHVSFAYERGVADAKDFGPSPSASATPNGNGAAAAAAKVVIHDVSLHVKKGEIVALVGESGSGKTTLLSLIPRFYDVQGGAVRINGTDIREFTLASLRSRIALVGQDTFLFHDTVRENIRLGRLDATDAEIEEAARAAYAHAFVSKLPKGFDTILGERGLGLSGGQKQRIAIARAVLRKAPILLLDEATSALDSESEDEVQKALEGLMTERAVLVVAHRLSTIKNADRIVVLSNGRVVETGTHQDLIATGGEYRRLHDLQFRTT